jgi:hypothetical protein
LVTPFLLFAQPDSIVQLHQSKFARNMLELGDLYCFSDPTFHSGKVKFATVQNVGEKYGELNLGLFPEMSDKTVGYYQFLNSLPIVQKENLIRMFSFYERKFDTGFKIAGLPSELKYIAPAISGLNQNAVGVHRAESTTAMYKLPKVNQARGLQSMTTGFQTANLTLTGKNGCVACFVIEKGSSLVMRDCFIVRKKDHKIADAEK